MAGLNILTLGSGKTYTNMVALGISNMRTSGSTVYFTVAATGEEVSVTLPAPADGISITNVEVNASKELIVTLSDNTKVNAGVIPTVKGDKGDPFKYSDFTTEQLESLKVKGDAGVSPTITENADNTDKIYKLDITTADTTFTTPNLKGADGQGGGTADVPIEKIKVNGELQTPVNKVVDITVPSIEGLTKDADLATVAKSGSYEDLSNKPTIPSLDGYAKTSEIPSKVSELENDSNYLSSIPEEYVTETELSAKGYLTEHQDISGKVDKVEGKSLISDTEIARLATVDNYDDTAIRTELAKKADATAIPSKVSELTNDSNYQTAEQVNSTVTTEIAKVVADAPESLNTLKEMSDWIAGHENDASAMNSAITDNKNAITALQTGKADKSEIPTTVAELSDSADYAKKTDLHSHTNKTVLDGITSTKVSNWDSAKTHADSAHAPSNAQANVIETVKVNGSALSVSSKAVNIDLSGYAVNEDLDTLEYSEVAGGKNLIDVKKIILGDMMEGKVASGNNYITDFIHLEYGKKYILSNCYKQAYETAWFTRDKKFVQRTFGTELTPPTNDCYYVRIEYGVEAGINAQLEEGTTATPYEPYIPSMKMLYDKTIQIDDLNVLGWAVPRECPIQNYVDSDNIFHQRVGRVDLGSLSWTYDTLWKATSGVSTIKNFTVNMYHSVYVPTAVSVSDMPTNSVKKADSGTLWINNGSSTEKPSGYLYFELATEKTINVDGNEVITKVNDSLDVIGKCKNLLNPTLQTTTQNGVTCTNNGDGTYTLNGTASADTYFNITSQIEVEIGKKYKLCCTTSDDRSKYNAYMEKGLNGFEYSVLTASAKTAAATISVHANVQLNDTLIKPMLTTDLSATYDDFVPYTGDGETLTHDVAEIKNDLSVKKFELVAGTLWLCVSGKHCVLTLNGYNLTETTYFDKLKEYQPYLVARNVVSKGDSVCIAAVDPNGNINASDLVVGTQLTGQLFGEISWIANI